MRLKAWFQSIYDDFLQNGGPDADCELDGRTSNRKEEAEEGELPQDEECEKPNDSIETSLKIKDLSIESVFSSTKNSNSFRFLLPKNFIFLSETKSLLLDYSD